MAEYLFIGGAEDGRRINVPDGQTRVRVPRIDQGLSETLYRREQLASPSQHYVVFVENGLTLDAALQKLITHYCPQAFTVS